MNMTKFLRLVVVLFSAKIAEVVTALSVLGSMEGQYCFERTGHATTPIFINITNKY